MLEKKPNYLQGWILLKNNTTMLSAKNSSEQFFCAEKNRQVMARANDGRLSTKVASVV